MLSENGICIILAKNETEFTFADKKLLSEIPLDVLARFMVRRKWNDLDVCTTLEKIDLNKENQK